MSKPTPAIAESDTLTEPVLLMIVAVVGAAVGVVLASGFTWKDGDPLFLGILAAFAVLSERFDVRLFSQSRVSVSPVAIMAAGAESGLIGVAVVSLAASLSDIAGRDKPLYKSLFNVGALLLPGATYVVVFESMPIGSDGGAWPQIVFPGLLAAAANFGANSFLVAMVIALDTRRPLVAIWNENFRSLVPHYVVFGLLAAALVSAYRADGVVALLVLLVPVAMMRVIVDQSMESLGRRRSP